MKLGYYYFLSWLSGILTLVFSVGGALAFVTYISSPSTVDGIVRPGHMSVMEFVLPLFLIGIVCFILYLCVPQPAVCGRYNREKRKDRG